MSESDAPRFALREEVSVADIAKLLKEIRRRIVTQRRRISRSLLIVIPLAVVAALAVEQEYTATARVIPYRSAGSGTGLSGLASLAGVRLGQAGTDQTVPSSLYPELSRTLDFRLKVAETPLSFDALADPTTLNTYLRHHYSPPPSVRLYRFLFSLPFKGAGRPTANESKTQDGTNTSASPSGIPRYDKSYLGRVNALKDILVVEFDSKSGVISISATMPDALASASLVRASTDQLMRRIIQFEAAKADEQLRFVEDQLLDARRRFTSAQVALARFTDRNRVAPSALSQIEAQRLQSEYNLAYEVVRQFSAEREQAIIKRNQDTPVFATFESVTVPSGSSSVARWSVFTVALIFGLTLTSLFIAWKHTQ